MPKILFTEFENENLLRKYPFTDASTLISVSGYTLATDVLEDASICSCPSQGHVFLAEITAAGEFVFCSASSGFEVGRTPTARAGHVLVYSGDGAVIGSVVMGEGSNFIAAVAPLKFAATAAVLCPACVIPVPDSGLLSLAPAEGRKVAGAVTLVAGAGVEVTCRKEADKSILRVDFVGTPEPEDPCGHGGVIKHICVEVWEGSQFAAAHSDGCGTLSVSYLGKSLPEACADKNLGRLPDAFGNLPTRNPNYSDSGEVIQGPVPDSGVYHDDVGRQVLNGVPVVPAAPETPEESEEPRPRKLLAAFTIDIALALGSVTLVSFSAADEPASRLCFQRGAEGSVEIVLLGQS